ncbi:hypothetical protein [Streptomyces sp. NBC_01716]|uniref:hypothetical protein n=1 Tax=Streptomyces sp. NBC_01716 TaxID=2975917 RepID=UPI002E325E11|nr:hypothetical protein [Streptomyces sp. NBC_01716]
MTEAESGPVSRMLALMYGLFGMSVVIGVLGVARAGGSLVVPSPAMHETVPPWGRLGLFPLVGPMAGVLAATWTRLGGEERLGRNADPRGRGNRPIGHGGRERRLLASLTCLLRPSVPLS